MRPSPVRRATAALGSHLWVDHRDVHSHRHVGQRVPEHDRPLAHRIAADAVGDVDDLDVLIDRADDAVAHTHEVVVAPVVGE
jgi:hypothetical protein